MSGGVPKPFFSFNPSIHFLKLHLNSGRISWLGAFGLLVIFLRHSLGCYNKSILDKEISAKYINLLLRLVTSNF